MARVCQVTGKKADGGRNVSPPTIKQCAASCPTCSSVVSGLKAKTVSSVSTPDHCWHPPDRQEGTTPFSPIPAPKAYHLWEGLELASENRAQIVAYRSFLHDDQNKRR